MREYPGVDILVICGLAFAILANFAWAFGPGVDDSSWVADYDRLDDLDQAWIAAATLTSTSQPALKRRGEVRLAAGYRRLEVRRRARRGLTFSPLFVVVGILFLAGLVPIGTVGALFGVSALVLGVLDLRRNRQIKSRYREVQDRHLAIEGVTGPVAAL
jgi:hypothetical protein